MGRSKYSKSELFIMEFIVVVLFFAVCISICISAFVRADNMSEDSKMINRALTLAQTIAEEIKVDTSGLFEESSSFYNEEFFVREEKHIEKGMLTADIKVYKKDDGINEIVKIQVKKYLPNEV